MVCPWWGREMEQGELHSRGGTYFLPEGEKTPKLYTESSMKKKNAILFPPDVNSLDWHPDVPVAYVCRQCHKLVIPYEE